MLIGFALGRERRPIERERVCVCVCVRERESEDARLRQSIRMFPWIDDASSLKSGYSVLGTVA